MINHVSIGVRGLARAKRYYDAALEPLGYNRADDGLGYGKEAVSLWTLEAERPVPVDEKYGLHFCFDATIRESVGAFHVAGLAAGGRDNGKPGLRAAYGPDYYAAFVIDLVGYRIEAFLRRQSAEGNTLAAMEPNMGRLEEPEASEHYVLFDTAIGTCGVAWSAKGLTHLQLPERDRRATEQRLRGGSALACTGPAPVSVTRAIVALQRYFAGRNIDFRDVELDLERVSPFHRRVYEAARGIGWGQTASYGMLARQVESPGAARAVGHAMARNPVPIIIPCHRVIASGRKVGGFSAFGGAVTKERLLALEGISLRTPLLPLGEPERS